MSMARQTKQSLLLATCIALAGCADDTLLHGLDEKQANEVVATLLRENIDATKRNAGKLGFEVRVGHADVSDAIDIIHRAELPTPKRTYVDDQLGAQGMVSSPQSERARLISAIERRLEESLTQMTGVLASRVHASYPIAENGLSRKVMEKNHVAVLLVVDQVESEENLVQGTKRLLRNSFENISYDDVSVVVTRAPTYRPVTTVGTQRSWLANPVVAFLTLLAVVASGLLAVIVFQRDKARAQYLRMRAWRWRKGS